MAEGPIRRACNRCHTQKLSCKRLGNEPCERCVRLKAECKSSPSLRFRKPSNGSNKGTRQSNLRQNSTSQQDHRSQKRANSGMGHGNMAVYTETGIPYPGPYSFNGMAEQLWPAHNVDAGLLIYHSDGNQIYQALLPQHIGFQMDSNKLFHHNGVTSPVEEIIAPSKIFNTSSTHSALPLMNSLTHSWATSDSSPSPCGTGLAGSNGLSWKSGVEAEAATKAMLETSFLSQMPHEEGYIGNILSGEGGQCDFSHAPSKSSTQTQHASHRGPLRTIPKSSISALCDMSAQLWDMSNIITVVSNHCANGLESMSLPQASSQSMASSGITRSSHDSSQGNTHGGGQSSAERTHDQYFPMDSLFAVSRNFIQTVQIACHGQKGSSGQTSSNGVSTKAIEGASNDRVDAESFIVLADSTYAALLDVYQRVFHLVDVTANSERPPSPSHNSSGNTSGSDHFMCASKSGLKQSLLSANGVLSSSWKDSAALSCLRVCRFPDVSVGGFPIVSTPALQLGLGLRLADDFLSHFSNVVATMHTCLSSTTHGDKVPASVTCDLQQQQQLLPTVSTSCLPHPPLVITDDLIASNGLGVAMNWEASTATSVSSSSGASSLFSLQYGLGMHKPPSSMDDIVHREHDLKQELAGLRNKLAV